MMGRLANGLRKNALWTVLLLTLGCGGSGPGGTSGQTFPELEISPAGTCTIGAKNFITGCEYGVDQSQLLNGDTVQVVLRVKNSGERQMLIESLTLEYTSPAGVTENPPAFELKMPSALKAAQDAGTPFYVATAGEGTDESPEEMAVVILFTRYDEDGRSAKITLDTDAANATDGKIEIDLSTTLGPPSISVNPDRIDFGTVGKDDLKQEKVTILNVGGSDLQFTGFTLQGSPYFALAIEGNEYGSSQQTMDGVTFETPIIIPPQMAYDFKVNFAPANDDPATGRIAIFSNDPLKDTGVEIILTGNEAVPCIETIPEQVNFGARKFGEMSAIPIEISACGESPLSIYGFKIKDDSSPDFDYDTSTLDHDPTPTDPVIVPIGGSVVVKVTYVPDAPNPVDGNNNPILDTGTLIINNNAFEQNYEVPISGVGVEIKCPMAIIKCQEGEEVIPQTLLHLRGDQSYAQESGSLEKWEWAVEQPLGSASTFIPSPNFPNPTFEANVAGPYVFSLNVFDTQGLKSCEPAIFTVTVVPDEAIHIELLWHTPEDPDETDTGPEAGADMDLHFVHPLAGGPDLDGDSKPDGWFAEPYDCYWFNGHPNWGSWDPSINDDPGLDRDDTDGAGPENVNLDMPENVTYRVGVHYWADHGYGSSLATVRVYIFSLLVFQAEDVMMIDSDMWEVCTVQWPSGKVQVVVDDMGQYKITPDYNIDIGN